MTGNFSPFVLVSSKTSIVSVALSVFEFYLKAWLLATTFVFNKRFCPELVEECSDFPPRRLRDGATIQRIFTDYIIKLIYRQLFLVGFVILAVLVHL